MAKLNTCGVPTIDYSEDGWNEFKKWIDGTYASFPFAWVDEGPAYQIIVVGKIARVCSINKTDAADFETNWKHIQQPLEKILSSGEPVTAPGYSAIDDSGRFLGDKFIASGLATTIHDFKLEHNYRLSGAHWWIHGGDWGDTADFSVVDKDDVLGLFQYYGLEEGDVLELKKYVVALPIPPSGCCGLIQEDYFVENPAFVCSGLYLRCVYDSLNTAEAHIGITYQAYQE